MKKRECGECFFWDEEDVALDAGQLEVDEAQCKRYPPTEQSEEGGGLAPWMPRASWCGEWKRRKWMKG